MTGSNRTTNPLLRAVGTALALALAAPPTMALLAPPAAAQDYAPVVIVNDEIITGYDVAQRLALLKAASGGDPVTREQAIEVLIDDTLRIQAARKAGIVPTKAQIDEGFAELASGQGRDPQTMRRYFRSQGVSERHLDGQIAAEVAWRDLIPRTFMPRVRISDDEVEEALGTAGGGTVTQNQYLLSEIRLPVGSGGQAAALAQANAILASLRSGAAFGDVARQRSGGSSAAVGGDLGWVNESDLSPAAATVVPGLGKDRVSQPFLDGNDVVLVGVRNTRAPTGPKVAPATYRISQLVVGVAPDAAPSIASLAQEQARAAKARVTDCASIEALKGEYLPISGEVGTLTPDQMPAPVRDAVVAMPVGGISDPIRSNDGFHIIVLCDRQEAGGAAATVGRTPDQERMRTRLTAVKLARFSASLMRKLRREAVIERR